MFLLLLLFVAWTDGLGLPGGTGSVQRKTGGAADGVASERACFIYARS